MEENAEGSNSKRERKRTMGQGTKRNRGRSKNKPVEETPNSAASALDRADADVTVSLFDYTVENHLRAIETVSFLCGLENEEDVPASEIERFSSAVTFLTEWRHFYYKPKPVRFAYETGIPQVKDVVNGASLPQFSAATVPKMEKLSGITRSLDSSKDFILHVGGPVWALDWCPRIHQRPEHHTKCEYLAVAAHPPDYSYHKIGAPVVGRGVIQIWCILNFDTKEESAQPEPKRRGRPRKKSVPSDSLDDLSRSELLNQLVPAPNVEVTKDPSRLPTVDCLISTNSGAITVMDNVGNGLHMEAGEDFSHGAGVQKLGLTTAKQKKQVSRANKRSGQDMTAPSQKVPGKGSLEVSMNTSLLSKDSTLPRLVFCLAHNGKVAWDVKWQPYYVNDPELKHHMGYLAVLLGNGALEVWEVPFPSMIKIIYTSCSKEGTDPRFVKLDPIFRCSKIMCGDHQSIPLTVEWSTSAPHEFILAGCHDGTVAMWKFSPSSSSEDTRPLLCFTADTVPIRALAWAPDGSDAESRNLVVTAGHGGIKFWDIRDPYRPLWDFKPVQRVILGLDWLQDPRCIVLSFDDGTLRILSLSRAAYDVPVTGKPFAGTQQQGLQSYYCSSNAIWSVQVSRLTGLVAYCGEDGSALLFQLTSKSVEKDPARNRVPHFLCGSLTEEDSILTINTPLMNTPFPMRRSQNEWGDTPRSIRGFLSDINQGKRANLGTPAVSCDELAIVLASDNCSAALKSKTVVRPKTSRKKKADQRSTTDESCLGEPENSNNKATGRMKPEIEVFPPKIVAMHRVRWNMNKGSERWLCYGGAAGIIRCKEMSLCAIPDRFPKPK